MWGTQRARKTETSSSLLKYEVCEHASLKSLGEVAESPLDTIWVTVGRFSTSKLGVQALHTVGSCIYPKQGSPGKERIIRLYYSVTMLQHVNIAGVVPLFFIDCSTLYLIKANSQAQT